jgi:predicted RecB family nuclease
MAMYQSTTSHDKVVLAFLNSLLPPNMDYWTSVEVYNEAKIGQIDIVIRKGEGYTLIEAKSGPKEMDEAIGQILRHKVLFSQRYGVNEDRIGMGITCPLFYPSHIKVCDEIGIKLWRICDKGSVSL